MGGSWKLIEKAGVLNVVTDCCKNSLPLTVNRVNSYLLWVNTLAALAAVTDTLAVVGLSSCLAEAFVSNSLNLFAMAELQSMKDRRLENLDSSIGYYGKRLLSYEKKLKKLRASPSTPDNDRTIHILESLIELLKDVISYLKLC